MMPMDKSKYPQDWKQIALEVKERANWTCEECGLKHGQYIIRVPGSKMYLTVDDDGTYRWQGKPVRYDDLHESLWDAKEIKIVMTVHHKGVPKPDGSPGDRHDKMDCRPENLVCLCQRCHWMADIDIHVAKAQKARKQKYHDKILQTGQLPIL